MKRLIERIFFVTLVLTPLLSCESNDEGGQVSPAMLQMVNEIESCSCNPELRQYFWAGQVVYFLASTDPACLTAFIIYDKNGHEVSLPEGYDYYDFLENSLFLGVVWKCDDEGGS